MSDVNKKPINVMMCSVANHKPPLMLENRTNGKWVTYGADDTYPDYLIDMFNRSAKHGAIITGKVNYIIGGGLKTKFPAVQAAMDKCSPDESWQDLVIKIVTDFEIFNGIPLEIIWNRMGKFASIRHLPFNKIRKTVAGRNLMYCEQFGGEFTRYNPQGIVHYKPFDEGDKTGKQLLYFRLYRPNTQVYPLPDYMAALAAIETDVEIDNFHLNNIKNGFWGDKIISFNNGVPDLEEDQKAISDDLKYNKTGTDNAGKFVLTFSEGADKAPTVLDISAGDLDKKFEQLRQDVNQTIFTGHKITSPALFGIMESGKLGNTSGEDQLVAEERFIRTYVANRRKIVLSVINSLIEIQTGVKDACFFDEPEPMRPFFSEEIVSKTLTPDEIRATAGYDPLSETAVKSSVNDAINSLSPLVANKVLVSMTPNEIRSLVSLGPVDGGDVLQQPSINAQGDLPINPDTPVAAIVNDNVKNLTAKQHQQLLRIIRQYTQGKLTQTAATTMLKTGLGLNDEEIFQMLGIEDTAEALEAAQFALEDNRVIDGLRKYGMSKDSLSVITGQKFNFSNFTEATEAEQVARETFKVSETTAAKVLNVYKNDSNATKASIAKLLSLDESEIEDIVSNLVKRKQLKIAKDESLSVTNLGLDAINNASLKTEIFIMYDYSLSPGVGGEIIIPGTREFCREVIAMNKMWSLSDIQELSLELGYDVWERRGGLWRHKDGEVTEYCRHRWQQQIVTKIIE